MSTSPPASRHRPNRTIEVVPSTRVSRPPTWAATKMAMPIGTSHSPLSIAESCLPSCRKTGSTKSMPSWPMATVIEVIRP